MREDYRLRLRSGLGGTQKPCHSATGGLTLEIKHHDNPNLAGPLAGVLTVQVRLLAARVCFY